MNEMFIADGGLWAFYDRAGIETQECDARVLWVEYVAMWERVACGMQGQFWPRLA